MTIATAAALAALLSAAAFSSAALAYTSHNDLDKRPVEAIAGDLGVTPEIFVACFCDVRPAEDFHPTTGRERANKAILLPCLQKANPALTNDRLDAVMDSYRGRHLAGT